MTLVVSTANRTTSSRPKVATRWSTIAAHAPSDRLPGTGSAKIIASTEIVTASFR